MKNIKKYIIIFILGSLIGWLYEYFIGKQKNTCGDTAIKKLELCLPLLTIYGMGGIILLYIKENFKFINIFTFSLIATIILTIFECICGKMAKYLYNLKEWDYCLDKRDFCFCEGYISLLSFTLWYLFAMVFYKLF